MQKHERSGILICYFICLLCAAGLLVPVVHAGQEASLEVGNIIRQQLSLPGETRSSMMPDDEMIFAGEALERFYQKRHYRPLWSGSGLHRPQIDDLINTIEDTTNEGLTPEFYHLAGIKRLLGPLVRQQETLKTLEPGNLAELDLLLTDAYLLLACHFSGGCVNPVMIESEWHVRREKLDVVQVLEDAVKENLIKESLRGLAPREDAYAVLRQEFGRYRTIVANGGWPEVPEGVFLKKGLQHQDVPVLRRRLAISGDLPGEKNGGKGFDEELEQAVVGFQERHGLKADGVVGPLTRKALNVTAAARTDQILVNLERLRWLAGGLGENYIYVNIADYTLEVMEKGRPALSMKVVVGKPYWYTPVFSAKMTYLIVNPAWNIPESIVYEEILPKVNKDPGYLSRQKITVLSGWGENTAAVDPAAIDWHRLPVKGMPYRFRQEPGPLNPLGKIKFMFPNRFNVYLHDTPARGLFEKGVRTFSHGCIRLEKPFELAQHLLQDNPESGQVDFNDAVPAGEERLIKLARPIDVHIVYLTAWSDGEGRLHFRDDIYGRDAKLRAALRESPGGSDGDFPARGEPVFHQ